MMANAFCYAIRKGAMELTDDFRDFPFPDRLACTKGHGMDWYWVKQCIVNQHCHFKHWVRPPAQPNFSIPPADPEAPEVKLIQSLQGNPF